jgi:hypothetical protein
MNLQPLRVLMPGRVMLVMLLLLGLGLGWYFVTSSARGDHLVRRNFNHLNQVTANINASVDALRAQVKFNQARPCPDVTEQKACLKTFRDRLVNNSPLILGQEAVYAEIEEAPIGDLMIGTEVDEKYTRFDSLGDRCIDPNIFQQEAEDVQSYLVPGAIRNTFFVNEPLTRKDPYSGWGAEPSSCLESVRAFYLEIDLYFSQIEGLSRLEGYFDSIIIARPTTESDDSEWDYLDSRHEILFNTASREAYSGVKKLREIFLARSGFERYTGIYELEYQHGVNRRQSALLPGTTQPSSSSSPVEPANFTQSTVVPFEVGGFNHLAFVQPVALGDVDEDLLIIGVVEQSKFNKLKYSVPLNTLSLVLIVLVVVALSLNFIRLALIGKRGVLFKRDLHLSYLSMVGMASLIVILIGNLLATMQFHAMFEEDQHEIVERLKTDFKDELLGKLALMHGANREPWCGSREELASFGEEDDVRTLKGFEHKKELCSGVAIPDLSALFYLDKEGWQVGTYSTHLRSSPSRPFRVNNREYFRTIKAGEGWQLSERRMADLEQRLEGTSAKSCADADTRSRFFMARIESYVDSELETAISAPYQTSCDGDTPRVTVAITRLKSLEDVVLPPGVGFAVFENSTGKVLFHSDHGRSLRENFYRATDDNPDIKAAVIANVQTSMGIVYKGDHVNALLTRMGDTPWTLVVYYRSALVDIINFHFGMSAAVLSAGFILLFLVGSGLLAWGGMTIVNLFRSEERKERSMIPHWVYPTEGMSQCYVQLSGIFFALLWLYTGVTYYLDIYESWPWLLLVPAMIFGLWHRWVRPGYYKKLPAFFQPWGPYAPHALAILLSAYFAARVVQEGGVLYLLFGVAVSVLFYRGMLRAEHRKLKAATRDDGIVDEAIASRRLMTNYHVCATIFILLLSVSPTILLYNENFDVHEKLWLEYTNWSNVNQLRDRAAGYKRYKARTHKPSDLERYLLDNWQGVYLPRTEVFVLKRAEEIVGEESLPLGDEMLEKKVSRWRPEERADQPGAPGEGDRGLMADYDREFTTYMLVAQDVRLAKDLCHAHVELGGEQASLQCGKSARVDDQIDWLKNLVKALPSFSNTGSLLESFTERARLMHDVEPHEDIGGVPKPLRLIAIDEYDPSTGMHYLISSVFPHTRSAYDFTVLGPYFLFLLLSGFICYKLSGFLAEKQLGGQFAQRRPKLDRVASTTEIQSGCLLIVPAHIDMAEAFEILTNSAALSGENFSDAGSEKHSGGLPAPGCVSISDNYVLVHDFAAMIGNRLEASRVAGVVESACGEGKRLLVLGDIDPKYWMRWRHADDNFPDELFYRWEALLVDLQSFCLKPPRGENFPRKKSRYRRNWQFSSRDERLLLAGLHYEGVVNYMDLSGVISLYRRGLVGFKDFQFLFDDPRWERFISRQISRDEFKHLAARYENKLWLSFRGPILLALLVTLGFVAYVAQDEMRIAFSILATVGGTIATVGAFSERLRDFRSYLGA